MHTTRRTLLMALAALALPGHAPRAGAITATSPPPAPPAPPAPGVLLASVYGEHLDPRLYLVSEKFDGVRALWDGRELRFRSSRLVHAPAAFTAALPPVPLDGELWLARGRFDALSAVVRSDVPDPAAWQHVRYQVFELPGAAGSFAQRAQRIRDVVEQSAMAQLHAVDQRPVADRAALRAQLSGVLAQGGEGLVLHRADAPYQTGRSDVLVKLKPHLDAEARVLAHLPGKGKYAGQTGALWVRSPEGREFALGSGLSDAQRRAPPPLGSSVTYRYRDLTSTGLPRFATFMRAHHSA